jgi:hypothetical protein
MVRMQLLAQSAAARRSATTACCIAVAMPEKAAFFLGAVEIHRELMTAEHSRIIAAKL